ncbi:nitroreductase family deazaflavin-dependent oxidoreductase [Micromonospora sp. 067-2]|uniref:nitroreductase family deazaflavin-dependent oxidoreductase n=1 Tax=Micromonospora sp. 067-2 TaxID=2789270 RepID=UPI00397E8446
MTASEQVTDSPEGWVAEHIQRYVETDGAEGHEWRPGVFTLLLTTRGRHSGKLRRTALIYGRFGEDYLVVGSQGGAPKHPAWVLNLLAEPQVEVQVAGETFRARARTATSEERPRVWSTMTKIWPAYDDYQTKTDREIPVLVLERV